MTEIGTHTQTCTCTCTHTCTQLIHTCRHTKSMSGYVRSFLNFTSAMPSGMYLQRDKDHMVGQSVVLMSTTHNHPAHIHTQYIIWTVHAKCMCPYTFVHALHGTLYPSSHNSHSHTTTSVTSHSYKATYLTLIHIHHTHLYSLSMYPIPAHKHSLTCRNLNTGSPIQEFGSLVVVAAKVPTYDVYKQKATIIVACLCPSQCEHTVLTLWKPRGSKSQNRKSYIMKKRSHSDQPCTMNYYHHSLAVCVCGGGGGGDNLQLQMLTMYQSRPTFLETKTQNKFFPISKTERNQNHSTYHKKSYMFATCSQLQTHSSERNKIGVSW